jgi:hypothetical protein
VLGCSQLLGDGVELLACGVLIGDSGCLAEVGQQQWFGRVWEAVANLGVKYSVGGVTYREVM